MFKKTRFFIGLSLIAQSVTFITMFFVLWRRKRSLAGAFLAVGAAGGITGTIMVFKSLRRDRQFKKVLDAMDELCGVEPDSLDDSIEIPVDDTASEADFE